MTIKQSELLSVEDPQGLEAALVRVFPSLNADERQISLSLYRLLTGGGPVSLEGLAESVNLSSDAVSSVLDRWPAMAASRKSRQSHRSRVSIRSMGGRMVAARCRWFHDLRRVPMAIG